MTRLAVGLMVLLSSSAMAEASTPAPELQMLVLLKVVTYDATFAARGSGDFVVLVPYEASHKDDADALVKECNAMKTRRINDRALQFQAVTIDELAKASTVSAVLVPRVMQGDALKKSLDVARSKKVYSFALEEAQVKAGAMLGVSVASGRPQPLLNPASAKAVGAELSPAVLKIVRTVSQ